MSTMASSSWIRAQIERDGATSWSSTIERFGEASLARLPSLGAVLVTPDFVPQRLEAALLAHLEGLELEVVAAVPRLLTPHDTSTIYSPSLAARGRERRTSSWLSLALFGLGASVLLIVRGPATDDSVQARINAHKGPSSYLERVPASLRGMSPIAERYFSLVHSPDDYLEFLGLCDLVMGPAATTRLLEHAHPPVPRDALRLLLGTTSLRQESHPFDVLFRCMALALATVVADPRVPPEVRPHEALSTLSELRRELRGVPRGRPLVRAAMNALEGLAPTIAQARDRLCTLVPPATDWRELCVANARIELGMILAALCDRKSLGIPVADAFVELLRRNQCAVDEWTHHRLRVWSDSYGGHARVDEWRES